MASINIGDRVRYKGAKPSVFGREGLVRRVYHAHSHRMLEVDFEIEVYGCWEGNLEVVEMEVRFSTFPPEEVSTARGTRPPPLPVK